MKKYQAIVIGSGCAAYSCALKLHNLGITNIAIVTEGVNCGTSRNTGSDKQTYYKLSMSAEGKDDAMSMAQSFFDGGSMHGDFALIEAANSARCFMRLVDLGVPFPTDIYGNHIGYQTDHDTTCRATSIGPLTSKVMTERLEKQVLSCGIEVIDKHMVIRILTDSNGVCGVLAINIKNTVNNYGLVDIYADNVVLACGAPAGVYKDSVFPVSQNGATSLALDLGLSMRNFSEWQYGIASIKFRWNLSGSYQQVLPRYVSIDAEGNEHEFLSEYYKDTNDMLQNIFLKGYQWPFDYQKINGSSKIDMLIYDEIFLKSRKVYLDYMRNPKGYNFETLPQIVADYLTKSQAVKPSPIERLKAMNPQSIDLYRSHNIDLSKEYLEINIAAQHNNGGVKTDTDWKTDIDGLYVIGEAAGTFGVYRPGGSALNDTQVSAMRAAESIALNKRNIDTNLLNFSTLFNYYIKLIEKSLSGNCDNISQISQEIQLLMSKNAAFIRSKQGIIQNIDKLKLITDLFINDASRIPLMFKVLSNLKSAIALSQAILSTMSDSGSRGSAIFVDKGEIVPENANYRKYVSITNNDNIIWEQVRDIPKPNNWFETVWREYNARRNL